MKKPKAKLIGQDGNIFNLIGIASRVLRKAKMDEEASEMMKRACATKSYHEALAVIMQYVEVK